MSAGIPPAGDRGLAYRTPAALTQGFYALLGVWTLACLALFAIRGAVLDWSNYGQWAMIGFVMAYTWYWSLGVFHTLRLDDQGRLPVAERIARRLAGQKEVVAVVGHIYSEVAVPISIIYGAAGLLFISTGATDPQFSLIPNPYSLRVSPNDEVTALAMAGLAHKLGLNKLVVIFQRGLTSTFYGRSLANLFSEMAVNEGLNILHVRSFFPWQDELRPLLAPLRQEKLDGLVVVGFLPQAGQLISQARSLGIRATILGGDSLDDPDLLKLPGKTVEGVIVATFFREDLIRPATREFVTEFRRNFGKEPDDSAAAAFDAVMLIAAACQQAGSSVPLDLANALTYQENFPGAASVYNFDPDGDPIGRWVWFKEVKGGQFVYLPDEYQPQNPAHLDDQVARQTPPQK
jgi:branched-chain amino acid transport system substrate-binding protein